MKICKLAGGESEESTKTVSLQVELCCLVCSNTGAKEDGLECTPLYAEVNTCIQAVSVREVCVY